MTVAPSPSDQHSKSDKAAHPGALIRDALKDAGFSIPGAAIAMAVNRSNLNNMLLGKASLSHDMAYRLNVLIHPEDEAFDFARAILGRQSAYDWDKTASLRNVVRAAVRAGRKNGEMHDAGTDGHLTLTAFGLQQKMEAASK
ncbi:hypothetical protein JQK15_22700 [Sphingobium sp. BHU LFT2]|uniref:helix-turn-helix transcriptional regulator n=1 Tax=Sphingobium sp. BHU LFT2 TaxID=2807634 RepID=UPI001BED30F0|nr:hypothetical protein [Sphingobium sp. BHU LFT2]MBT2246320.1 hypothetical protein [Sphingobium sp. BHU LFT2]